MAISHFLSVNQPCDEVLQWTKGQLLQLGLHPVQTFDLHTARVGLQDCSCPNHGTDECDCQLIVLLVYETASDPSTQRNSSPVTLILHGNDGQTWLSLGDGPRQLEDPRLPAEIKQALGKLPVSKAE